jgi:hypothetical protein
MSNFAKTKVGHEVTLGMQALKRIGKPEDVADVVALLVQRQRFGLQERVSRSMEV